MTARYVTVSEACDILRVPGPHAGLRLRRRLRRAERDTGTRLLLDDGTRARPTYRVDLVAVREACPDIEATTRDGLVATAAEGMRVLRREMERLGERLGDVERLAAALAEAHAKRR